MYCYTAFGLGVHSELSLPELVRSVSQPDITIRVVNNDGLVTSSSPDRIAIEATANEARLVYDPVGTVSIRNGSEIVIAPAPHADEQELRFCLLGPAMALALHQRGRLVLHASACWVNGQAIAFLGAAGSGKSTMAAAMVARGHPVITDDLVVVSFEDRTKVVVYPGFPVLKLWPEAAAILGGDHAALPRVSPKIEKRVRHIDSHFAGTASALGRIYVLAEGDRTEIESLTPSQSFIELVRHSFLANILEATEARTTHFRQCTRLAALVPHRVLKREHALSQLPALAELIERDVARAL